LAETVPVGIWHIREDGETIYVNPLLGELLGLDPANMSGAAALLGGGRKDFPGRPARFEADMTKEGGSRRVLVISSGWLPEAGSQTSAAMVSVVDVSEVSELHRINDEISRLNRQLAENMQKLKEAQDENVRRGKLAQLGQLTATVAHELRNPMGSVRTSAFLLERKIKGKGFNVEAQTERIKNGITRCDNIITQLLDFARAGSLQCETIEIDEWLAKLIEEEAPKLPAAVAVECHLCLGDTKVQFDPGRLSRVIINLMSSASEAMVGKGHQSEKYAAVQPQITITTRQTARGIEMMVADNGPGISEDNLKKILEPLFTTKNFGTGLGLPAVEKILEQHGGGLEIASKPGQGARFTAWIPARQEAREAA
jgi:signal transduction histidine kinase